MYNKEHKSYKNKTKNKMKGKCMSKKIIAGALGVATVVGSFAVLGGSGFADTEGWHQVNVAPGTELILEGSVNADVAALNPTITGIDTKAASALEIQSSVAWKLQYQAVTGEVGDADTDGAEGTNLGTAGFAATGGYAYAGANTVASAGSNNWGVQFAGGGTGATVAPAALSGAALANVATGVPTVSATVTATYTAGTDGSLGQTAHYGTIYYSLTANS